MSLDYIVRRQSGFYSFRITVPKRQKDKFGKNEFWVSLKTKDRKEAIIRSAPLLEKYTKLFSAAHISDETPLTISLMQDTCRRLGIERLTPQEIEAASIQDYVAMMSQGIEALQNIKTPDIAEVAAIGGAVEAPAFSMLDVFKRYVELTPGKYLHIDERAQAKKINRYKRAAQDFVDAMGEIDVIKMTSKEAHQFAAKMVARVTKGEIELTTAKARVRFVKMFVKKVFQSDYPKIQTPFESIEIESNAAVAPGKRPQFTEGDILKLQAALDASAINDELRAILTIAEYTGTGMGDLCLLEPSDFHLEGEFPFITIGPNSNRAFVKTGKCRHRDIPLIGRSLDAAKRYAKTGFPRYCRPGGPEAASAAANALIKPVTGKTTGSFRHRFAYLLENSGAQSTMKNSLMGHHSPGVTGHYGDGYDLKNKHEALSKAFALAKKKQQEIHVKP
jgi:integrase